MGGYSSNPKNKMRTGIHWQLGDPIIKKKTSSGNPNLQTDRNKKCLEVGASDDKLPKKLGQLLDADLKKLPTSKINNLIKGLETANDPAWIEVVHQLSKTSCIYFSQSTLRGPPEAPYNGKFLVGDHHEEWDQLMATKDRVCLLAGRDLGKTYAWSFAYPIWRAMYRPNGMTFIFSATQPQAERILDDIKNEVMRNSKLEVLRPKPGDKWTSTSVRFGNGARIFARGFGTKVRGAHPDCIIVDDGLNDETMYSEMVRNKQNEYFYSAITNMIVPGGQIVVVGTPIHENDLYGALRKNPEYYFAAYPSIKVNGEPLWPERYNAERLEKRKAEIGSIRFSREFLCQAIGDDMSLFPGHLFRGDPTEQFQLTLGMPSDYWKSVGVQIFMGVDFAMSSSINADYTVIFVMGLDSLGNRWIVDIVREKGMAYQDQLSLINTIGKKYEAGLIYLEANQMQRIFGDELIRTTDLPIKQFVTGVQKNSLDKGVPSLRVLLENKKFRIPRGDKRSIEITDQWIDEMRAFTWANGKLQGVGSHDDLVMSCWVCDQAVRQGAFSVSFGTEDEYTGDQDSFDDFIRTQIGESSPKPNGGNGTAPGGVIEQPKASGNLIEDLGLGLPPGLGFGYDF